MTTPTGSTPVVSPTDLGTYLGVANIDTTRATAILAYAQALCESILATLPAGAASVILDVAARAYGNPGNLTGQTVGGFSANYGTIAGGLWLTRQNKATLRRLAGGGGAFGIDLTPVGAGTNLPPWDTGVYFDDGYGDLSDFL